MAIISKEKFLMIINKLIKKVNETERLKNEFNIDIFDDILTQYRFDVVTILQDMFELEEEFDDPCFHNMIDFYIEMCSEDKDFIISTPPEQFYDELIRNYNSKNNTINKHLTQDSSNTNYKKHRTSSLKSECKYHNVPFSYKTNNKLPNRQFYTACSNNFRQIKKDIFGDIDISKI